MTCQAPKQGRGRRRSSPQAYESGGGGGWVGCSPSRELYSGKKVIFGQSLLSKRLLRPMWLVSYRKFFGTVKIGTRPPPPFPGFSGLVRRRKYSGKIPQPPIEVDPVRLLVPSCRKGTHIIFFPPKYETHNVHCI